MNSHLVEYLKTHTIEQLVEEKSIIVKEYDNFRVFNYNQIDNDKLCEVTKECRGIILDKKNEIVCRPFGRFFNYGEHGCASFNFENSSIVEKVDGSLIKVWCDWSVPGGQWQIATRGTAFGESQVMDWSITFKELFLRALSLDSTEKFEYRLHSDFTYLFELSCMENRVVTKYDKDTVVFLAKRDNDSGDYKNPDEEELTFFTEIGVRMPKTFSLNSIKEVQEAAENLTNLEEGFIVYENGVPVCKIKSPTYVIVHHIRGEGLNKRRIAQLVWSNEEQEYLSYFPEDEKHFKDWRIAHSKMVSNLDFLWNTNKGLESQKDFAMQVKDSPVGGMLFNMRKGLTSVEALAKVNESAYVDILSKYLED